MARIRGARVAWVFLGAGLAAAAFAPGGCSSQGAAPGGTGGGSSTTGSGQPDSGMPDAPGMDVLPPEDAPHDAPHDVVEDVPMHDGSLGGSFCELPGSLVFSPMGEYAVKGGLPSPDLTWLHLPEGFCVHYYANIGNARQVRVAPGGEVFVASPTMGTTGGGPNGLNAIMVVPDDNKDGFGDAPVQYLGGLPSTQGLLFAKGDFYYQDGTAIRKLAYHKGDRVAPGPGQKVIDVTLYSSGLHWPKAIDLAKDGTVYVGNGGDQGEACDATRPFHGGILSIDGTPDGKLVAKGLRNPIALRCERLHDHCYALELNLDYSSASGGREKILPIRAPVNGIIDDWGFPCCGTTNVPYQGVSPVIDCSKIASESAAFIIGDTPFGIDYDELGWPAPWTSDAFVTMHGVAGSWQGARLVAVKTDPSGAILPGNDLMGNAGSVSDFATGWDDGAHDHGRPAALTMAPDGRLFLTNDVTGDIVWIAPVTVYPPMDGGFPEGGADGGDGGDAGKDAQ